MRVSLEVCNYCLHIRHLRVFRLNAAPVTRKKSRVIRMKKITMRIADENRKSKYSEKGFSKRKIMTEGNYETFDSVFLNAKIRKG